MILTDGGLRKTKTNSSHKGNAVTETVQNRVSKYGDIHIDAGENFRKRIPSDEVDPVRKVTWPPDIYGAPRGVARRIHRGADRSKRRPEIQIE